MTYPTYTNNDKREAVKSQEQPVITFCGEQGTDARTR